MNKIPESKETRIEVIDEQFTPAPNPFYTNQNFCDVSDPNEAIRQHCQNQNEHSCKCSF